jgi:hypothetical protein
MCIGRGQIKNGIAMMPNPEVGSLEEFLEIVDRDEYAFFG